MLVTVEGMDMDLRFLHRISAFRPMQRTVQPAISDGISRGPLRVVGMRAALLTSMLRNSAERPPGSADSNSW